jgi:hypothetical protein
MQRMATNRIVHHPPYQPSEREEAAAGREALRRLERRKQPALPFAATLMELHCFCQRVQTVGVVGFEVQCFLCKCGRSWARDPAGVAAAHGE